MKGSIGFLVHPGEGPAIAEAVQRVRDCGLTPWVAIDDPDTQVPENAPGTRLLVTVGGDGTFLYGARLAAPRGIPVLGVNRGRLGFLTDTEVAQLPDAISGFVDGDHHLQHRSLFEVELQRVGHAMTALALNDVAIKSQGVAVARIKVDVDGDLLGEFDCDGVVIASATGSTAYALSAGGPPIDPRVRAVAVVPLAPHGVITRPVVLPDSVVIDVTLRRGDVVIAADGRSLGVLEDEGVVTIRPGPELSVVRFDHSPTFLRRLREKVHFGLPLKELDHVPLDSLEEPKDRPHDMEAQG